MTVGTLAVLINSTQQNWLPERWKARFDAVCGGRRVVLLPDAGLDPAEVHYAAVWKPVPGELGGFPNLRVDLQSRRRRRCADGGQEPAERAAGARRRGRSHRPHDRICRACTC